MYFVKMPLIITINISGTSITAGYVFDGLFELVFTRRTEKYDSTKYISLNEYISDKLIIDIDAAINNVKLMLSKITKFKNNKIYMLLKEKRCDFLPIGISFSGQIDEDGIVNSASSIFGKYKNINFNIKQPLNNLHPNNEMFFINNISAASYSIARMKILKDKRFLVIHIGSGFGSKVYDGLSNSVILDKKRFSGELGHLSIDKKLDKYVLECDCGETNHLAAFILKKGIINITRQIVKDEYNDKVTLANSDITEGNVFDIMDEYMSTVGKDVLNFISEIISKVVSTLILSIGIDYLVIKGSQFYNGNNDSIKNNFVGILHENIRNELGQYYSINDDFIIDYIKDEVTDRKISMEGLYNYINLHTNKNSGITGGYIDHYSTMTVNANNSFEFPIIRTNNIFNSDVKFLKEMVNLRRVLIIIDANYNKFTKGKLRRNVKKYFSGTDSHIFSISPADNNSGEIKDSVNLYKIIEFANQIDLPRDGIMIAIGGGVILDLVGFAAQQYRRMVDYIRIPTTLIGQIDAGIGIKVGINYKNFKNLIGGFYPPKLVVNSFNFLFDLPNDAFECGISEILKIGIVDSEFIITKLNCIDEKINSKILKVNVIIRNDFIEIMDESIRKMLLQLNGNLFEKSDLKRLVDFGHTFSPMIESLTEYKIPHGFAVAIDMFVSIVISYKMGLIPDYIFNTYERLFKKYNLLIYPEILETKSLEVFKQSIHKTILHRGGNLNLVLPFKEFGNAIFLNLTSCSCLSQDEYPYIISFSELEGHFKSAIDYLKRNNVKVM